MIEREKVFSETFVQLADTLVSDFDVSGFLYQLVENCPELFDVNEAGLLLANPEGTLQIVATTSEATHIVELLQIQNDEGPCLESFQTGLTVMVSDLTADDLTERWPVFAAAASRAGFASAVALPMRWGDRVIGSLNMFRTEEGEIAAADVRVAQALADVATIGLLQNMAARDARIMVDQLQGALNSRVVIEQAKGIIAQQLGVDMGEAFSVLRRHARTNNERITEVSRRLIDGELDASQMT